MESDIVLSGKLLGLKNPGTLKMSVKTPPKKHEMSLYAKAVKRLIRAGARSNLRKVIAKVHPSDLAAILEQISPNERQEFLPLLFQGKKLGWTLIEMYEGSCLEILEELEDAMIARIVAEIPADDASDLLELLPQERTEVILTKIDEPYLRKQLEHLLTFSPSTAGGIMQTEFLALPETETVEDVVELIRRRYRESPIFYLYTLDGEDRLAGIVSFRQLLLAQDEWSLSQISSRNIVKVHVDEDQEEVAQLVYKYDLLAVPVVDSKNRMVGIITVDDVMDVMEEEVSEDIYRLAGSDSQEMVHGEKILRISRVRLPWLLISVVTGLLTAGIIGLFNETLETVIVLTSFIPVIAGMAGNIGTQSSAITVRGLAIGRITTHSLWSSVFREMRVGVVLGIICSLIVGLASWLIIGNYAIAAVVGISMFIGVSFAATTGTMMPILFARLNIDPAVASGPLVTTLNDCVSVIIYLGFATMLLKYLV